jgi:hypothetical protein
VEYQRRPPTVSSTSFVAPVIGGTPTALSAVASDPDPGDTLAYSWVFPDGATADGPAVTHTFGSGPFSATAIVRDPTGLTATGVVTGVAAAPPPIPDKTPPVVSSAAFSPKTFRASVDTSTATTAKATPVGSTLKLRLSEQANLTIVIAQKLSGRESKSKSKGKTTCKAETKSTRHAKKCTYYSTKATLRRNTVLAGSRSFAITGRFAGHALKAGSYRATIGSKDVAGNKGKDVTATFVIASK